MGLPPAADEYRHGERYNHKNIRDPPESKPCAADYARELEQRDQEADRWQNLLQSRLFAQEREQRQRDLDRCRRSWEDGKQPIGIFDAHRLEAAMREEWLEVRRDRREARSERQKVRSLNPLLVGAGAESSGGPLCGAWQSEDRGWNRVRVIMDSGAAESVCPRAMAPQFRIEDSLVSRSGVYYTSANGGKIMNLGEQHVPVCLSNGARTICTFQVADVSRPLMSVAKLCEMGNRVLFGTNGGVILNLRTGHATPFQKEEGVYMFDIWIPPLAESPFARQ